MTLTPTADATGVIFTCPKKAGFVTPHINVQAIRLASGPMGSTQRSFADAIGVPVKTLRNWEQGRRKPTGPALVLLALIQRDPGKVAEMLKSCPRRSRNF